MSTYRDGIQEPWQEVRDISLAVEGTTAVITIDLSECSLRNTVKVTLRQAAFHKLLSEMLIQRDRFSTLTR